MKFKNAICVCISKPLLLAACMFVLTFSLLTPVSAQCPNPVDSIFDLIDYVVELNLHNGIENSLDAKLNSAIDALLDTNDNNDIAASNKLLAFINAVEAQADKKIDAGDAFILIAMTEDILQALGCIEGDPPSGIAVNDSYESIDDACVLAAGPGNGLLSNDTEVVGPILVTAVNGFPSLVGTTFVVDTDDPIWGPSEVSITVQADGSFVAEYCLFEAVVEFTYEISGGSTATVHLEIRPIEL